MFDIIKFLLEKKKVINENIDDNEDEEETDENERECKSDYDIKNNMDEITDCIFELAKNLSG